MTRIIALMFMFLIAINNAHTPSNVKTVCEVAIAIGHGV